MKSDRRLLQFDRLEDVMPDVRLLLDHCHHTVGRWTLAQICDHLAKSIGYSMDGFPGRSMPWLFRQTLGRLLRGRMLARRRIQQGVPIPDRFQPVESLDPQQTSAALAAAIGRFLASTAPLTAHPLFGQLRRQQWDAFHRIHCAHHLSFAKLKTS